MVHTSITHARGDLHTGTSVCVLLYTQSTVRIAITARRITSFTVASTHHKLVIDITTHIMKQIIPEKWIDKYRLDTWIFVIFMVILFVVVV